MRKPDSTDQLLTLGMALTTDKKAMGSVSRRVCAQNQRKERDRALAGACIYDKRRGVYSSVPAGAGCANAHRDSGGAGEKSDATQGGSAAVAAEEPDSTAAWPQ